MPKIFFVPLYVIILLACDSENKPTSKAVPAADSTCQNAPNSNIGNIVPLGTVDNGGLLNGVIGGVNQTLKQLEKNVFDALDELIAAIKGSPGNKDNGVVSELIGQNFLTQFIARFLSQNGAVNLLVDPILYRVAGGPPPKGTKGKPLNLGPLKNILGPILANDYSLFDNNADYLANRFAGRGPAESRNEKLD